MTTSNIKRRLYGVVLLIAASCGNDAEAPVPAGFEGKKLVSLSDHPDRLLTPGAVATIIRQKKEAVSMRLHSTSVPASGIMATYSWPAGIEEYRRDISGRQIAIPSYASVAVGLIKQENMESFRKRHGSSTGVQQEADALAMDSTISTDISLYELQALEAYAKLRTTRALRQVGDMAYWEMPAQALHVLANGSSFTVVAAVGNEETNRRIAIEIAARVMATKL